MSSFQSSARSEGLGASFFSRCERYLILMQVRLQRINDSRFEVSGEERIRFERRNEVQMRVITEKLREVSEMFHSLDTIVVEEAMGGLGFEKEKHQEMRAEIADADVGIAAEVYKFAIHEASGDDIERKALYEALALPERESNEELNSRKPAIYARFLKWFKAAASNDG